jgi:hypothetical protein
MNWHRWLLFKILPGLNAPFNTRKAFSLVSLAQIEQGSEALSASNRKASCGKESAAGVSASPAIADEAIVKSNRRDSPFFILARSPLELFSNLVTALIRLRPISLAPSVARAQRGRRDNNSVPLCVLISLFICALRERQKEPVTTYPFCFVPRYLEMKASSADS